MLIRPGTEADWQQIREAHRRAGKSPGELPDFSAIRGLHVGEENGITIGASALQPTANILTVLGTEIVNSGRRSAIFGQLHQPLLYEFLALDAQELCWKMKFDPAKKQWDCFWVTRAVIETSSLLVPKGDIRCA